MNIRRGIVLYSDGGNAGSNPGPLGAGAHGYVFEYQGPAKAKDGNRIPSTTATQLGYLKGKAAVKPFDEAEQDKISEYWDKEKAYEVKVVEYLDMMVTPHEKPDMYGTNNAAELRGFTASLNLIASLKKDHDIETAIIFTDSRYVVEGTLSYLRKWIANGWRTSTGKEVQNKELWESLNFHLQHLKETGIRLKIKWIKGHAGELGNEKADQLASMAAEATCERLKVNDYNDGTPVHVFKVSDKEQINNYWKPEAKPHPLIKSGNRLLFNPVYHQNGSPYFVVQMGHGQEDKELGKATSDCAYGLIQLNQGDEVLEGIIKNTHEAMKRHVFNPDSIVLLNLNNAISNKNYTDYLNFRQHVFKSVKPNLPNMFNYDNQDIATILYPKFLSGRAYETFETLTTLVPLIQQKQNIDKITEYVDITDTFYETKFKKDKKTKEEIPIGLQLKPEFVVGLSSIDVNFSLANSERKLTLSLGLDLPERNILKRLEEFRPKINLVLTSGEGFIYNYMVYIELTTTGEYGLFRSSHSNTIFVNESDQ